jgi:hypothetical protein
MPDGTDYNRVHRPPEECTPENDAARVTEFSDAMLDKWQKGRKEHGTVVKIDPLLEAQNECIDIANYAMDTFFRLGKLREGLLGPDRKE